MLVDKKILLQSHLHLYYKDITLLPHKVFAK